MNTIIIPATVSNLVTYTRELRSVEATLADSNTDPQLRRVLNSEWSALMDTRQHIVAGLLSKGVDTPTLLWICQHASDWDLMNLYCDRDADHLMIAQANAMMTA